MTVDHTHPEPACLELHVVWQGLFEKTIIGIAGYGDYRPDLSEQLEHVFTTEIAGVNDQVNLEPIEEIEHVGRQPAAPLRLYVRVADHPDRQRQRELALRRDREQLTR